MTAGETSLARLLQKLQPGLDPRTYVFCVMPPDRDTDSEALDPFAMVNETEGRTLVLDRDVARRAGLNTEPAFRRIVLGVHSSLQAVGLTAAVAGALAGENISANVIAGFHHDHIFVPEVRAEEALTALKALSASGPET